MTRCLRGMVLGHPYSSPFIIKCKCGRGSGLSLRSMTNTDEPSRFKADECRVQLYKVRNVLNFGINRRSKSRKCLQDLRLFFTVDIPLCYLTKFHLKMGVLSCHHNCLSCHRLLRKHSYPRTPNKKL